MTLTAGQTFYEGPDDIHVVGRSASSTEPAKLLVLLLKNKGAPVLCRLNECHMSSAVEPIVAKEQR